MIFHKASIIRYDFWNSKDFLKYFFGQKWFSLRISSNSIKNLKGKEGATYSVWFGKEKSKKRNIYISIYLRFQFICCGLKPSPPRPENWNLLSLDPDLSKELFGFEILFVYIFEISDLIIKSEKKKRDARNFDSFAFVFLIWFSIDFRIFFFYIYK